MDFPLNTVPKKKIPRAPVPLNLVQLLCWSQNSTCKMRTRCYLPDILSPRYANHSTPQTEYVETLTDAHLHQGHIHSYMKTQSPYQLSNRPTMVLKSSPGDFHCRVIRPPVMRCRLKAIFIVNEENEHPVK